MKRYLCIYFIFHIFNVYAYADVMSKAERTSVTQYLQRQNCLGKIIDHRRLDDGNIIFWGLDRGSNQIKGTRLFAYDLHSKKTSEILPLELLERYLSPRHFNGIIELSSDKNLKRLAINILMPCIESGKYSTTRFLTEIHIFDISKKMEILNIKDGRFHTCISLSDNGNYLAYYSHPDTYSMYSNFESIPMNRSEIMDLSTREIIKISDESYKCMPAEADFIWSSDSNKVLFTAFINDGAKYEYVLMLYSHLNKSKNYYNLKNSRGDLMFFNILENNRIIYGTYYEIIQLDDNLKFRNKLYEGKGINSIKSIGNKIVFKENLGKSGYGLDYTVEVK